MADVNLEQRMEALRKENQSLRQEVARLRADNRRWARLAGTDALTGLAQSVFHSLSEALYAAKAAGGNQVQVGQEIGLSSS
jgi:GGDEF domain-containing protein